MGEPIFDDYKNLYPHLRMERANGLLELVLHTDNASLLWDTDVHEELGYALGQIGADRSNHVIVITGAGSDFCVSRSSKNPAELTPTHWDRIVADGRRLVANHLEISVPIIAAVNGRAHIHAELALLADIVICDEQASFRDAPHFVAGIVPGDGVHILYQYLLGPRRGRYFLLTGQTLGADQALDSGLVNEVVPARELLDRAREIAHGILRQPFLTRRYARYVVTAPLKRLMDENLTVGLALEGLARLNEA